MSPELKQKAIEAFMDIMDGLTAEEIVRFSGMRIERAEEYVEIYREILKG